MLDGDLEEVCDVCLSLHFFVAVAVRGWGEDG